MVEEGLYQACEGQGQNHSDNQPGDGEHEGFPQDHADERPRRCAKCGADAEFAQTRGDGLRYQSIDARSGEEGGNGGEDRGFGFVVQAEFANVPVPF